MEVKFRTKEIPFSNLETQVEKAWSIGEQLSKDLEFYADLGASQRPSPFRSLAWFWGGCIGVVCVGAVTLQMLGPPMHTSRGFESARASKTAVDKPSEPGRSSSANPSDPAALTFGRGASRPEPGIAGPATTDAATTRGATEREPWRSDQQARSTEIPTDAAGAGSDAPADTRLAALTALKPAAKHTVSEPEMVMLPGAVFRMGSNEDHSERPVHPVVVEPFLLAKSAVTVRQWQECVDARVCTLLPKGRPDQLVTNVSWDDAQQFVSWLSDATSKHYRLPTEAEWEYAARAGTDTRYSWGNALVPGKASCKGCGEPVSMQTPPAAEAYPPNPFGLFGMGGGAAEWVADCWHHDYQDAPRDGATVWNTPDCRERVLRGGSWVADASYLRPSSRDYYDASVRYPTHGFRVARTE